MDQQPTNLSYIFTPEVTVKEGESLVVNPTKYAVFDKEGGLIASGKCVQIDNSIINMTRNELLIELMKYISEKGKESKFHLSIPWNIMDDIIKESEKRKFRTLPAASRDWMGEILGYVSLSFSSPDDLGHYRKQLVKIAEAALMALKEYDRIYTTIKKWGDTK